MRRLNYLLLVFGVYLLISFVNILFFPEGGVGPTWKVTIPPRRGSILDGKGRKLSHDVYVYVAYLDVGFFRKHSKNLTALEKTLKNCGVDRKVDEVLKNYRFFKLYESESREEVLKRIESDLLPYVNVSYETRRKKLTDYGLSPILGSVLDGRGSGGLEGFFDTQLSNGKKGFARLVYKGSMRLSPVLVDYQRPSDGEDVQLSLDLDLQRTTYEILKKSVESLSAENGHVVVMESKTGRILSLVTLKDWNDLACGYIEPGSTMKPIVYAIALETGAVKTNFSLVCQGRIKPVDKLPNIIRDVEAHGEIDFLSGIVKSCNVMSVEVGRKIVEKIGVEGFYAWLRNFGFGEKTGVEFAGEIEGVLRKPREWSLLDFATVSIGQGIGVTPIQLVAALNVFANDGEYVRPTLLKDQTPSKKRVISAKTAQIIRDAMVKVVEEGTGRMARLEGFSVAGKTGTAQKAIGGRYADVYHSIFVGFFPADNPRYTILVHVDAPKGLYYGGDVAAPIFAQIAKVLLEREKKQARMIAVPKGLMPDLRGLSLRDALLVLEEMGIKDVETKGKGWLVQDQSPSPFEPIPEGRVVLYLQK